ncbi:MAG: efflux RND transporter permease subunit [Phycisphaeraceae bacterium]|nr:efflux RND transporter permease subunit [Phycisphaeraceae bacterium]
MSLAGVTVRRPVFAVVMSLVLMVLGVASLQRLTIRQYPDVDAPVVSISTTYRGASAAVIDAEITKRLIDQLSGIEGIRTIESTSSDESSRIDVEFTLGRDIDLAAADVRDQISRTRRNLPDAADDPIVTKASSDSSPIMWISLTSETLSPMEMTDFAQRNLAEPISIISGVASIRIGGERRYAIRIWLDRTAMAARGVTVDDVIQRLQAENLELPAGRVESLTREFSVRALSRLRTSEEFAALVIREGQNGAAGTAASAAASSSRVLMGDVARVEMGPQNDRTDFWVNGKRSVSVGVIRQSNANTIEVADAVREEVSRLRSLLPPEIDMQIASDDSQFIRESIREVVKSLLIAVGLVVLVILVFIGSLRATVVPSVAIPVSIIAAITVLYALGYSINVLTLLAGVLAIGLVVDDAIVVLENIDRRINEYHEHPLVAAIRGTREVGFAVIATTVVLVACFVPLAFLTGKVGRLFNEFGVALAAAVCFSSFVALTLSPMISSRVLKARKVVEVGASGKPARRGALTRAREALTTFYDRIVGVSIRYRWAVVGAAVVISLIAYTLHARLPKELTPVEDQGRFFITLEAPEGSSLAYTLEQARRIEQMLVPYRQSGLRDPGSEAARELNADGAINRVITFLAPSFGGSPSVNTGRLIVRFVPHAMRTISQQRVVAELLPQLRAMPGVRAIAINPPGLGVRGASQPVQYAVGAPDYETAREWTERIVERLRDHPDLLNLRAEYEDTKPQLQVEIDRQRAFDLGLNVAQIGRAMQTVLGGSEVTEFYDRGELYDVVLQALPEDRATPADLSNIYIRSATTGEAIPLSAVVTLRETGTTRDLRRINRSPSVLISASLAPGAALGSALEALDNAVEELLPAGARINLLGESLDYRESSAQLALTFAMALLIVYLALAAQFESWVHPLTILIAVPLSVTGGLASLYFTGQTLNIYSQIGMIMLIGLMAKHGILIVEFANQLRERGMEAREAAQKAAVTRLRPILMTAISTILGALPLVLAFGAGAEGRMAIGIVIVGGMLFSTCLTLVVIPALYAILAGLTSPGNKIARRIEQLIGDERAV